MKLPTVPTSVLFTLCGSLATFLTVWTFIIEPNASYVPQFVVGSVRTVDSTYKYVPLQQCEPAALVVEALQETHAPVESKSGKPVVAKADTKPRRKPKPIPKEDLTPEEPTLIYARAKGNNPMPDIKIKDIMGGLVMVRIVVNADGTVRSASVDQSSGSAKQDRAAVNAFKKWKFTPASRDGVAVQSVVYLPVNYGG